MHILIAPNAFKNSLSATAAAEAIRAGLQQSTLDCTCECFPVGDGGDGTAALLIQKCGGKTIRCEVHNPLGRRIKATFGLIDGGKTAVIELADASGLRLLRRDEFNPLRATTYGTGQLIQGALDKGAVRIILGIGGSATVDGGAGILQALGARFAGANGNDLSHLPEDLVDLRSIDLAGLDPRILRCELTVLCDVDNPLLGEQGAAEVFGPQKGATPSMVVKLQAALEKLSDVVYRQTGKDIARLKHGGAAGGVAAGLRGLLNAKLVKGIEHFLDMTGFENALQKADAVITGEGSIDEQTLQGKGPFGVARRAKKRKIPVIGLAGRVPHEANASLRRYFDVLLAIGHGPVSTETALQQTAQDLQRTAMELGNILALKK